MFLEPHTSPGGVAVSPRRARGPNGVPGEHTEIAEKKLGVLCVLCGYLREVREMIYALPPNFGRNCRMPIKTGTPSRTAGWCSGQIVSFSKISVNRESPHPVWRSVQ